MRKRIDNLVNANSTGRSQKLVVRLVAEWCMLVPIMFLTGQRRYAETDDVGPIQVYGQTKLKGELSKSAWREI